MSEIAVVAYATATQNKEQVQVTPATPLPVVIAQGSTPSTTPGTPTGGGTITSTLPGANFTRTDRSGTIAVAATPQSLFATSTTRKDWSFQNTSTGVLTLTINGTAYQIVPFQIASPRWNPGNSVTVTGATAGQAFVAEEAA